jgi:hypothetical protein
MADIKNIDVFQTVTSVSFEVEPNTNIININKVTTSGYTGVPNLQDVTDEGASTTNSITANSFIKSGGTGTNVLLDNGNTVALSSIGGATNLSPTQTATNFTINSDTGTDATIPLGNGTLAGATLNDYTTAEKTKLSGIATGAEVNINADWNATSGDAQILNKPTLTNFVPYTGATNDVDLGLNDITAAKLIKDGGTSSQFLKANGSVDNNTYLTSADLPSTLDLYATTTASDISGYTVLVRNIADSRYNTTAVDVPTPTITGTLASPTFCGAVISDPSILLGNPGVFNFSVIGKIRRVGGSTSSGADFFYSIYKRDISEVETLIANSAPVAVPANGGIYTEYISIALWNNGIFLSTDRVVLKFYGIQSGTGSGATYEFLFGGTDPVRGTAAISSAIIPNLYLRDLADVEKIDALNNEVLYWNDADSLWEHSLAEDLVPNATATQKGLVSTTVQTFAGAKTFTGEISASNLSGTNTGDNAINTQYSGLATSKQDTLQSTVNIKSINGTSILGSGDLTISGGGSSSQAAYTILANNTNATAVPTTQVYKDIVQQSLSNTSIVWTGTTAPSGTSSHTYKWSQIGKLVTLRVNLVYTVAGNALTMVSIPFDNMNDLPVPATVTGFTANGETFCFGVGLINTAKTAPSFTTIGVGLSAIRRNTTGTGTVPYDLLIIRNTVNALVGTAYIQYYTT